MTCLGGGKGVNANSIPSLTILIGFVVSMVSLLRRIRVSVTIYEVVFLDVVVSNKNNVISTRLYSKPTDANRYLHSSSFHPKHTFRGLPYSQMRRAAVISSNNCFREETCDMMVTNFSACGYDRDRLSLAKSQAMALDRESLLAPSTDQDDNSLSLKSIKLITTYHPDLYKFAEFIQTLSSDLLTLIGHSNVMVVYRRNSNTASLLFNRYGFSQNDSILDSQRCGRPRCKTCPMMFDNNNDIELNSNINLKLSKLATCKSEDVIYVCICKVCKDYYFGQTISHCSMRMNGHRAKFTTKKYKQSALSFHMYQDHLEHFEYSTQMFNCAIVEAVSPNLLDRRESYYIWKTEADIRHLNRIKVVRD